MTPPLRPTMTRAQILDDIQASEQHLKTVLDKLKGLTGDSEVVVALRASHHAVVQALGQRLSMLHAQLELGLHA